MEILALNPGKNPRKKKHAAKGATKMARRRDSKGRFLPKGSSGGGSKRKGKRKYRKNPGNPSLSGAKRAASRGAHHVRGFFGGLGLGQAAKVTLHGMIGIAAASMLRKKFGDVDDARGNWGWKDYLMAGLGALAASTIAKHVFKASPDTSKNILVGGLVLIGYRILTDEVLPKNDTLKKWFGEEGPEGSWQGLGAGEEPGYLPGDVMLGEGGEGDYVMGEDMNWRPIDDTHRQLPEYAGQDESAYDGLTNPGSMGEEGYGGLEQPSRLGAEGAY
jgi:hypothetical protein